MTRAGSARTNRAEDALAPFGRIGRQVRRHVELRVLFASYHSYLLAARGWECQAFCGPQLDYEEPRTIGQTLHAMSVRHDTRAGRAHGLDFVLYNAIVELWKRR